MANETIKKKRWRKLVLLALILIGITLFFVCCNKQQREEALNTGLEFLLEFIGGPQTQTTTPETQGPQIQVNVEGEMIVHFIDVGQADATLFVQNGHVMLFDAATKSRGDELVEYIQELGITYIDVLVLTHPHDDHMGGAAEVLNNIEIGVVYGPDIFDIKDLSTIGWYSDMIDAIDKIDEQRNKGVPKKEQTSIWQFPRDEDNNFAKFNIGDAVVQFYAPLEDEYSDKNDYSICAKVSFGTIDVFLTGDATSSVEKALIDKGYNLDVEIFQASHHGSDTGNSEKFLEAMSPECVVISCGMKNKHNHPVKSVMELYKEMDITVYRTDESGNIIMTTDGTTYSFDKSPGTYTSGKEYKEE